MIKLFWVFALLGTLLAGAVLILTVLIAQGAPQQAAGAAIAAAVAIIPYVLARAVESLGK